MSRQTLLSGILGLAGLLAALPAARAQDPQVPPAVQPPFPALSPEYQQFLDQVLAIWEQRSKAVERYQCTFKRWEYDGVFGPREAFKSYSEGVIKYAVPDKGMFKVEKIMDYAPPVNPGEKAKYVPRQEGTGEWWICDGQSVFEHDAKNKELIQRELPPQMRGKAIAEGPLPFLFGAEREKIKQRYWIQPLPMPPDVKGEYWLEAYPKTRQDAANYQKVHVIIDHSDFLPKGLVIFDRNFDPVRNPTRTTLTFDNRQVNWSVALDRLNIFYREFYEPKVPFGWKKRIEKYDAPPNADQFAPAGLDNAGPVSQIPAGPGDPLPR